MTPSDSGDALSLEAIEAIARERNLSLLQMAFRTDRLLLLFDVDGQREPSYVIELKKVASFFNRLPLFVSVTISLWDHHGSFGWWLPSGTVCKSIKITSKDAEHTGGLLALARDVIFRKYKGADDLNWPG
jgi:hypothetical protein